MQEKKQKKTIKVILGFIAAIVLITLLAGVLNSQKDKNPGNSSNQTKQDEKQNSSLAKRVEATYLETLGVSGLKELHSLEGMPTSIRSIVKFEDGVDGTVRVLVQENVDKEEAKEVGRSIMASVGLDIPELQWVVVRGVDGKDVNYSRQDIPALR